MASRTNFQLRDNSVRDCESEDSPSGGRNPPIPSQVGNVYTGWNPNHAPQGRPLAVGRMSGPSNDRANQIAGRGSTSCRARICTIRPQTKAQSSRI